MLLSNPVNSRLTSPQQRVGNDGTTTNSTQLEELTPEKIDKLRQNAENKIPRIQAELEIIITQLKTIKPRKLASSSELTKTYVQCQERFGQLCQEIGTDSYLLALFREENNAQLMSQVTTLLTTIRDYKPSLAERALGLAGRVLRKLRP
jgi:hypothetical protein